MTENDNQTTETIVFDGFDTDTEGDEDIHLCKKCKLVFTNLSDYLQHKVKHDNYKVKLSRTSDRRMLFPQLIQKPEKSEKGSEKENIQRRRRGKKKTKELVNPDLVITERQSYWCPKCNIKFNREATLKRHVEYVHDQSGEYTTAMGDGSDNEVGKAEEEEEDHTPEESDPTDIDFNIQEELRVTTKSSTKEVQVEHIPVPLEDKGDRPYSCNLCGNRFKEAPVLRAHLLTHSSSRDFPCSIEGCTYAFKTKGSLKRHMRRHTGERPFKCEECGRTFTESGALTRHLKSRVSCKNKSDLDLPRYGKRWSANAMYEPQAKVETKLLSEGEDHTQEEAVKDMETECAIAEVIASNEDEDVGGATVEEINMDVVTLSTDNILEEEMINPTQCKVCKEDFLSCDILKIHLRAHLADIPFRCGMCHFVAESRSQLSNHMTSLHQNQLKGSELINQIPEGKSISDSNQDQNRIARIAVNQLLELPSSLEMEEPEPSIHRARNIYKCPVCAKTVKSQNYLRLHMKSHTGDRPHKCMHCHKSFITKDTLTKHLSVHNETRNFKCGQCGKLFKRISHVREHLKIHTMDRPFNCTVCRKTFKTNNAMKVHLRTHTSILPYVCPFCRRRFREKGSLLRHQRMHTGERPFKCHHCNRAFAEHGTLNRHLKAKVPCTRQLQEEREKEKKEFTVLAEFSSVVADTQQYIVDEEHTQGQSQEEEATEYVVVQTGLSAEDLQNVEIITEGEVDQNFLEGVQVTDDYVVITDSGDNMKILNSKTGETLAMMPLSTINDGGQIVTLPIADNQIEAVAMAPSSVGEIETVTIEPSELNKIEAVAMNPSAVSDSPQEIETITLLASSAKDIIGEGGTEEESDTSDIPGKLDLASTNEIEAVAMAPDANIGDALQQAMMAASVAEEHV
ncbi:transcription factor E4F1 [Magallana gigas]|uniref:transcription factor E4F1 n=1 Tax=Magallana gigas TaxID=29159 RepID=UPI003340137B